MTTYSSYEEAKIANPESEIWASKLARCGRDNVFGTKISLAELTNNYFKCNPADHCVTVERFFAAGYKFVGGDAYMDEDGHVMVVGEDIGCFISNQTTDIDSEMHILRAAALKPRDNDYAMSVMEKKVRVEYVKCEYGDKVSNIVMDFENDAPLYKMVNDEYWTIDELDDLFAIILDGGEHIYRRIETEVDERQEFIDESLKLYACNANEMFGKMYDAGCRFPD